MASTFCFDRDFPRSHEWFGGRLMSYSDNPPEAQTHEVSAESDYPEIVNYDLRSTTSAGYNRYDQDHVRARSSRKPITLRSWRNPRSVGGPFRKTAICKMLKRLSVKQLLLAPSPDGSRQILIG